MKPMTMYLDECITRGIAKNDSDIARKLGITRASVSDYRVGRSHPNDEVAVKIAELLGKDPGELLAECGAARAKSPATRRAWERIAARMAAYGITACVLIIHFGNSGETKANQLEPLPLLTVFRTWKILILQWLMSGRKRYDGVHSVIHP